MALRSVFDSFCFRSSGATRDLLSFPPRRSSDLSQSGVQVLSMQLGVMPIVSTVGGLPEYQPPGGPMVFGQPAEDRKSTRLNSSHVAISYAVFCLKKKKRIH